MLNIDLYHVECMLVENLALAKEMSFQLNYNMALIPYEGTIWYERP